MKPRQYALVAYVQNSVGRFVEDLRRALYPEHAHLPAHITVLPPRPLHGSEGEAIELLSELCREVDPFEVVMGEVESFVPVTPTVFIRVAHAAYKLRELHDRLNTSLLHCNEQWPYMPHLTIVKMPDAQQAQVALEEGRARWNRFQDSRRILVEQLTFVREGEDSQWVDLGPIPLGRKFASKTP
jgi:2'-5' RNA ligase